MFQGDVKVYQIPSGSGIGTFHAKHPLLQGLPQEIPQLLQRAIPRGFERSVYRALAGARQSISRVLSSPTARHIKPCQDRIPRGETSRACSTAGFGRFGRCALDNGAYFQGTWLVFSLAIS
jgi:hypothetical protein